MGGESSVNNSTQVQKLEKILHITKSMTQSHDLKEILNVIVQAAFDMIDNADTVIIYLYDQSLNKLTFEEGVGVNKKYLEKVVFSPNESLTGKTFLSKTPYVLKKEEVIQYMQTMSTENYHYFTKAVNQRDIKATIAVPLLYREECLGVLIVNNFELSELFSEEDLYIVQMIADQSAIAIMNSKLIDSLREKNILLEQSLNIHKQFTSYVLKGSGVEVILTQLEKIVKGNVQYVEEENEGDLFPIIHGNETLGYLLLEKPFHTFSSIQKSAIEHASTAITLELVKQNAIYEKELHLREEWFQQLLHAKQFHQIEKMIQQFNWDLDSSYQCMIVEGKEEPIWRIDSIYEKQKMMKAVEQIVKVSHRNSLVIARGYQIIIIFPATTKWVMEKLVTAIQTYFKNQLKIVIGIGRKTNLSKMLQSFQEAREAVLFGKSKGIEEVVYYANLGVERILQKINKNALSLFVLDKMNELLEMNQEYVDTFKAYVDCNRNHNETALRLHIHPNTLYYRLKKTEQALEIDFNDDKQWLNIRVAFLIYEMYGKELFVDTFKK